MKVWYNEDGEIRISADEVIAISGYTLRYVAHPYKVEETDTDIVITASIEEVRL